MRSANLSRWLLLLVLFCLLFPKGVSATAEVFTVARIDVHTKYPSPPPEDYLPLIPLKEGEEATPGQLESIKKIIQSSGLFRSVSLELSEEPAGISVRFDLWQKERVRKIRIKGNWLVLSSSIYRVLAMQDGDPFKEEELPREAERIEALYKKKGWYETRVTESYEQDPEDGSVRITYRIQRGHHIRFGPIELEGVKAGDPQRIRSILRIWPWVTTNRLDKRLEKVRAYYAKLGYPAARVRVESVEIREEDEKRGLLRVAINEGDKLVLSVTENEALSDQEIFRATTFFREQGVGFFDSEDSAEAIRQLYEENGFPKARVTFERKEEDKEVRVSFSVDEGNRAFIQAIRFQGNKALSDKVLSKQILTRSRDLLLLRWGRFVTDKWDKDRAALENLYLADGFRDVHIEHSLEPVPGDPHRIVLEIRIHEGPRYVIASSTVRGAKPEWEKELKKDSFITPGNPFNEGKLYVEAGRIVSFYGKKGYLLARVDNHFNVLEDHTVEITFDVDRGPQFFLTGLIITGNNKTRPQTIRKTFPLHPGDPIDNQKLSTTRQRLFRLGILQGLSLSVPGVEPAAQTTREVGKEEADRPVLIEVRERKSLGVEVGVSYDSDWGLEGLVSLREENLLGRAKKVTADGIGGQDRREARIAYSDPTLMGYQATLTAQAKYERSVLEAYTEQTLSFEIGAFRQLRKNYTPGLFLLLDNSVTYDIKSTAPDAPKPTDSTNLFVRPQLVRDTRLDKLYPKNGNYSQARVWVSNRAWGSDDNLVLYGLQLRDYFEFAPDWVLASRVSLDQADPYGSTAQVPSTYLLFAGGNDTVRGFPKDGLGPRDSEENPKGGTTRVLGNLEVRFPIYRLVHGVVFVDVGSLTDGFEKVEFTTFRWSAGAGLGLYTPVGPIRLEYGYQLQDNPPLNRGEFHFALGFPF